MQVYLFHSPADLAQAASDQAALSIIQAIEENGSANFLLTASYSQVETLLFLSERSDINWSCVNLIQLEEYFGLESGHPAMISHNIQKNFISNIQGFNSLNLIDSSAKDPELECERMNSIIKQYPIDVALLSIGIDGNLALNFTTADQDSDSSFITVDLVNGQRSFLSNHEHFQGVDVTPNKAITASIKQMVKSKILINPIPGQAKALAVKQVLEGKICSEHSASILQNHQNVRIYLDNESSSQLSTKFRNFILA